VSGPGPSPRAAGERGRRARVVVALAFLAAGALAGCGRKHPSAPGPTGGTPDDFARLVQASYVSGAVLPTTLETQSSLLVTLDVEGVAVGAALFRSGTIYVAAGTVAVRVNPRTFAWPTVDTLARQSVPVYNTPWFVYSSVPNLPALVPVVFDGVTRHHFEVSGTAAFPAFEDSVLSVARPVLSAPAAFAGVPRDADLAVSWSDAGTDSTVYVLCMLRSEVDTSRVAFGDLVRDQSGATSFPAPRLGVLPAGAARLSVARYRIARRTNGALPVNLVCEATVLRALTLN
jgi:hypothetical protein